ncbi:hypothetical protein Tsubulata_032293 [Turnera subulata]|uniref:F-box domain-containing protein n=1 Tax=Turnera subulata TaxID=218843 RepID=A0A9Q0F9H0_9ROSI|nr:hypothetical protein Tsubulata_032293 [Turnera subulata]
MSDNIPEDVIVSILSKLPAKSLMRFRCVSRSWDRLITSSAFINRHLSSTNRTNNLLLFIVSECIFDPYFLYPGEHFPEICGEELYCPFRSRETSSFGVKKVGSCRGVICLCDDTEGYFDRFTLWNPSIRRTVFVPEPTITFRSHGRHITSQGFGYDSSSNDYKLVRLVYSSSIDIDYGKEPLPPLVEVYSLKSGSWRMVPSDVKLNLDRNKGCAFMNGACHWLAHSWDLPGDRILSFDMSSEVFGEILIPDCVHSSGSFTDVADFGGYLTLVPSVLGNQLPIWVMKQYGNVESWTKLFTINVEIDSEIDFLAFRKNGEILFETILELYQLQLLSYDPNREEFLDYCSFPAEGSLYVESLEETLVLADEENGVWDVDAYVSDASMDGSSNSSIVDAEERENNEVLTMEDDSYTREAHIVMMDDVSDKDTNGVVPMEHSFTCEDAAQEE